MADKIAMRVITTAKAIINDGLTVRQAAQVIGVCKSTVWRDMDYHLPKIDITLAAEVKKVFEHNTAMRSYRGGQATKNLYARKRNGDL